ncbi:hypothetical protein ACQPYK_22245 [Streptosporangium sp. CA-135522]|uniref:hypothetical protein n=1 Tax=Streptosporangium sp. CA-135522 TaxID=3240072 RepID=UPI003D9446B1
MTPLRHARTGCRFGPTSADAYQGREVGTLVSPLITELARRLGRTRIMRMPPRLEPVSTLVAQAARVLVEQADLVE